jgi:hypothetical protein
MHGRDYTVEEGFMIVFIVVLILDVFFGPVIFPSHH